MFDRLKSEEIKIMALERHFFSLTNRYGRFELLVELILNIYKGFKSNEYKGGSINCLIINPRQIEKLYGQCFPKADVASIRGLTGIPLIDRRVALQSLINLLKFRVSPSLAIYQSWKKRLLKVDTIVCGTDHPYTYSYLLAVRNRTRQIQYYQHGFYPDKFYHEFSFYDNGFTIFKESWEYLSKTYPSNVCSLMPINAVPARQVSEGILIVVALPDFEYADMDKSGMYEYCSLLVAELITIYGKENLVLRPHPQNLPNNIWIKRFLAFNINIYIDEIQPLLEKTKSLILILPSTLKYEAEAMGIEVICKPPIAKDLVKYEIRF
jgi:hypothetical protein